MRTLVYGIGNSLRSDDGIGWFAVDVLEQKKFHADFYRNYQLAIEDVELITQYDQVYFIDAAVNLSSAYQLNEIVPTDKPCDFSTHSLNLESLLSLCSEYYKKMPKCYMLAIQAHNFSIGENISTTVIDNCIHALDAVFLNKA